MRVKQILQILEAVPETPGSVTTTQLCDRFKVPRRTMQRLMNSLETDELIVVANDGRNRKPHSWSRPRKENLFRIDSDGTVYPDPGVLKDRIMDSLDEWGGSNANMGGLSMHSLHGLIFGDCGVTWVGLEQALNELAVDGFTYFDPKTSKWKINGACDESPTVCAWCGKVATDPVMVAEQWYCSRDCGRG